MNWAVRIFLFLFFTIPMWIGVQYYTSVELQPQTSEAAIAAVNGKEPERQNLQVVDMKKNLVNGGAGLLTLGFGALCFLTWRPRPTITYIDKRSQS